MSVMPRAIPSLSRSDWIAAGVLAVGLLVWCGAAYELGRHLRRG